MRIRIQISDWNDNDRIDFEVEHGHCLTVQSFFEHKGRQIILIVNILLTMFENQRKTRIKNEENTFKIKN